MAVNIIDVAKHAGVSKSTVSLVIQRDNRVKPETRERVLMSIKTLNYVPNMSARCLTTKKTNILGVIVMIEDEPKYTYEFDYETGLFSHDIIRGIPDGIKGTDYGILTERYCIDENTRLPELISSNRVDGVFLIGGLIDDAFIDRILGRGLPAVMIGSSHNRIDSIASNVRKGAYLASRHLFETNHRKVCYINCPAVFTSANERSAGFSDAAKEAYIPLHDNAIIHCDTNTGKGGYLAMKALWESGQRPDGIAAANEPIALGIMRYLYEKGIRIPDDISIVGYEASIIGGYCAPPLTTVDISKEYMGRRAAELFLRRIRTPSAPIEKILIEPNLVVRNTVAMR